MAPRIAWTCQVCGEPIEDRAGYVCCSRREVALLVAAAKPARSSWEPVDFRDMKTPVPWRVYHARCDPDPGGGSYWMAVDTLRTLPQFLNTSAHLFGKRWIKETYWDEVMRGVAAQLAADE